MRTLCLLCAILIFSNAFAQWTRPVRLGGPINSDPSPKSWPSINATEDTIYYAKVGANLQENICYSYRLTDTTWSAPIFMPPYVNSPDQRDLSPSIGPGDSVLYFVTYERPGGYGSYDIWFTRRGPDGQWLEPENAGPNINTPSMEWGVFLSRDGQRLYFSSTRHVGTLLDIFVSQREDTGWGPVVRLPGQVNWFDDEESVTLPGNEHYLILTKSHFASTGVDLWRSDFADSAWSAPQPIDELNSVTNEEGASLTLDGTAIYLASQRDDSAHFNSQLYVSYWTDSRRSSLRTAATPRRAYIFPNPINGQEFILTLSESSYRIPPRLALFNLLGEEIPITTLGMENVAGGQRKIRLTTGDVSSGRYWLVLRFPDFREAVTVSIVR